MRDNMSGLFYIDVFGYATLKFVYDISSRVKGSKAGEKRLSAIILSTHCRRTKLKVTIKHISQKISNSSWNKFSVVSVALAVASFLITKYTAALLVEIVTTGANQSQQQSVSTSIILWLILLMS